MNRLNTTLRSASHSINNRIQRTWDFMSAAQFTGLILGLLGLAFVARPDSGAISFIVEKTGVTGITLGLLFSVCGFIIVNRPPIPIYALCLMPYLLYSVYAMWYYMQPNQPLAGVIANLGLALLMLKTYTEEQGRHIS